MQKIIIIITSMAKYFNVHAGEATEKKLAKRTERYQH